MRSATLAGVPGRARPERSPLGERRPHHHEQAFVFQRGVDAPEGRVPELFAIGQEQLDKAPLVICETIMKSPVGPARVNENRAFGPVPTWPTRARRGAAASAPHREVV